MTSLVTSGALLLVLLTGASYSYPAKKGFVSSASYSSDYGAKPGSASTGSNWKVPSSSSLAPAPPVSVVASETISSPPQMSPPTGPGNYQPSVQREPPAATYSSNSFAGPVPSGSASSSSAGSTWGSSLQDIDWAVAPPSPFSGEDASGRAEASRFAPGKPAPLGPGNVSPPDPSFPGFQGGELSHMENSYEHGNYESQTEDQNPPPSGFQVPARQGFIIEPQPLGPGRGLVWYPYDYMFLTGQYPPGTVSHYSRSFEHGRNSWQDTHYMRDYFPRFSTQQAETFQSQLESPQSINQPSKLTKRYGQGGETGQAQPYKRVGQRGPVSHPGHLSQPHMSRPGGGYSNTRFIKQ
ncbi:hypothetical protein PAMP_014420 [Pampus punctatissimus]